MWKVYIQHDFYYYYYLFSGRGQRFTFRMEIIIILFFISKFNSKDLVTWHFLQNFFFLSFLIQRGNGDQFNVNILSSLFF